MRQPLTCNARRRFVAALVCMIALLYGCGAREGGMPRNETAATIELLSPAAGDTVAGEVRLVAGLRGRGAVRAVVFLLDGTPLDTVRASPWETIWHSDAPPAGEERRIRLEGWFDPLYGETGTPRVRSAEVAIRVLPDDPPVVRLFLPRDALWIERVPGVALAASAVDPEEGPMPDQAILWSGEGLSRPLRGGALPAEILPEMEQTVTAEAFDRWGRRGACSMCIRPFRYRRATEPTECLENLSAAFQARDPKAWIGQTLAGFRFLPCAEEAAVGWESTWDRGLFERRLGAWLNRADVGPPRLDWKVERITGWAAGETAFAWITLSRIELRFLSASSSGWQEVSVSGAEAQLLLSKRGDEDGEWRVLQWRDFPGDAGPSLASILAQSDRLPAAPEGRRCRPASG